MDAQSEELFIENTVRGALLVQLLGFKANLEIRETSELSGALKMDSFLLRNQGITREFWLNISEIRENKVFLEKNFVVNFRLAIFSSMHIFMFWNIFLLFFAMSIMLQPGFLCLKIYEYSSVTCLIVIWCIRATRISI